MSICASLPKNQKQLQLSSIPPLASPGLFFLNFFGPPPLKFLWAPDKLVAIVVQKSKLEEIPAALFVEHSKHKVVEYALLDVGELAIDQGLSQEEADQWGLILREAQCAQALQDAGDAQVVVSVAVGRKIRYLNIVARFFLAICLLFLCY